MVSDGVSLGRAALEADVQPGSTVQAGGRPLPLTLTSQAAVHATYFLLREAPRSYPNKVIHAWIAHWIYADVPPYKLFSMQFIFGALAFLLQLLFSIPKDIKRIKQLRYGRHLKGPVLVDAKSFNKAIEGTGIGITTNDSKLPSRIPRDAENKHFLIVGDTGTGKTTALSAVRSAVEMQGYEVQGFAPTSRAARHLREAGIEAGTLQSFLARTVPSDAARERKHFYFVDESSLASTNQMREFLTRLGPNDRVLLIGDIRQPCLAPLLRA